MKDTEFTPWKSYPEITKERLETIAALICKTRREVAALHAPKDGDDAWSLGCRAYARICYAIRQATAAYSWLRVVGHDGKRLQFVFTIEGIPIRFYRGDPDDPPSRYLGVSRAEDTARQLAFTMDGIPSPNRLLRIAVDTLSSGEASRLALVELDDYGSVLGVYLIQEIADSNLVRFAPAKKEGVSLSPPTVKPIQIEGEKKEGDAS